MILCDVNVLLHVLVEASPHHEVCSREVERLRRTPERMALSELVLAAVLRIATNPKVFDPTPTTDEVFAFLEALRSPPTVRIVAPGPRHWRLFQDLVLSTGLRGADTTDAYLAALAIESGCEWWTTDGDFERFPGLRFRNLIA